MRPRQLSVWRIRTRSPSLNRGTEYFVAIVKNFLVGHYHGTRLRIARKRLYPMPSSEFARPSQEVRQLRKEPRFSGMPAGAVVPWCAATFRHLFSAERLTSRGTFEGSALKSSVTPKRVKSSLRC